VVSFFFCLRITSLRPYILYTHYEHLTYIRRYTYGIKLTFIRDTGDRASNGSPLALYKCACGAEVVKQKNNVNSGNTTSCSRVCPARPGSGGGFSRPKFKVARQAWANAMARCYASGKLTVDDPLVAGKTALGFLTRDTPHPKYHSYGGRGIKVCKEWHDMKNFIPWYMENVIEAGKKVGKKYTIDRIDVNGDYCPSNCRGADSDVQNHNKAVLGRNTSGYNGVSLRKDNGAYTWEIKCHSKRYTKTGYRSILAALLDLNICKIVDLDKDFIKPVPPRETYTMCVETDSSSGMDTLGYVVDGVKHMSKRPLDPRTVDMVALINKLSPPKEGVKK